MKNIEVVNTFVDALLENPEPTMEAVRMRLSVTDYELVLKKADVLKHFYEGREPHLFQFPYETAERT